jgi:thioredoxin reductase
VLHCPYCHGWEVRDQPVGILATGPHSLHTAQLFRQLTDDVTLLRHPDFELTAEQADELAARDIAVVDGPVDACVVTDDALSGVRLRSGVVVPLRALVVAPRPAVNADLFRPLGIESVEHPSGMGTHVPADPTGRTDVPGVWVAGNVTDLFGQVLVSAAGGSAAGAMINADLVADEVRLAVAARRPVTL